MNMWVDQIDTDSFTHIHFAFANVTAGDWKVEITDPHVKEQFELFKDMKDIKKIISFGGWDFSTMPGTYSILREAVKPFNRETFKNNLIAFMNEHNLDGMDLDWEYPGVSDPLLGGPEGRIELKLRFPGSGHSRHSERRPPKRHELLPVSVKPQEGRG